MTRAGRPGAGTQSNATPIEPEARGLGYAELFGPPDGEHTGWRGLTPRQARRYWHKLNRSWGGYEPVDEDTPAAERPKGHPTPRRADAIRGRLALRRFAEAGPLPAITQPATQAGLARDDAPNRRLTAVAN